MIYLYSIFINLSGKHINKGLIINQLMPDLSTVSGFDSKPKVESLPEGEVINVTFVNPEIEKTKKNGYLMLHLNTVEHGEMVTLATGVKNKLLGALEAVTDGVIEKFNEKDPLKCVVTKYESHGKTCTGLN